MDMGGDAGSTGTTASMGMMGLFHVDSVTPLYSAQWAPGSTGSYAGTCIFLIVLAVLFQTLVALRSWQESRWLDAELNRRYVVVNGKLPLSETVSRDSLAKQMTLSENGVEENVIVVKKRSTIRRPWRLSVDPLRALIDTVIAGVSYLPVSLPPSHPPRSAPDLNLQHVGCYDRKRGLLPLHPRQEPSSGASSSAASLSCESTRTPRYPGFITESRFFTLILVYIWYLGLYVIMLAC